MEGTCPRRYENENLDVASEDIRICERVAVRPGIGFTLVTGAEADDPLSQELTSGALPDSYHPLVQLLEALVPAGGRVLDLGTHVGTFTLTAAALGYEVLGVEASPRNASLLRASLQRNGFDRVRLVQAAVSDRPGTLEFCQAGPYGHVAAPGPRPPNLVVRALAVDDLLDEHGWEQVDFVKLDIEGSEVAGLRGLARRLGRADAPPLLVESNGHTLSMFGQTTAGLRAVLEGFGYRIYQVDADRLLPVRPADLQPTTFVDYLALKGAAPLEAVGCVFRIDPPLSRERLIERVLVMCRSRYAHDRCYIARALGEAAPAILARKRVFQAVHALRADASTSVRDAAASIRMPSALRARCTWWLDAARARCRGVMNVVSSD
jgi:FkbM family methyltransferase